MTQLYAIINSITESKPLYTSATFNDINPPNLESDKSNKKKQDFKKEKYISFTFYVLRCGPTFYIVAILRKLIVKFISIVTNYMVRMGS